MGNLIHSTHYRPRIYPITGDSDPAEMDRVQSIDPTGTTNRAKIEEVGRDGVVGYVKRTPNITYRMMQYEYGNIELFNKLCNKGSSNTSVVLNDFKDAYFDIAGYMLDDTDTFKGTVVYPNLRTSGFSLNIGDPEAIIERSLDLAGEDAITWQGNNKYYIQAKGTVASGDLGSGDTYDITLGSGNWSTYPAPVEDPNISGQYIYRVTRYRSGTTTELTITTDYTYTHGTTTVQILSAQVGDIYKVYYTASTYVSGGSYFTDNDTDVPAILAEASSLYIYTPSVTHPLSSDYIYRIQNVTVDVRFDREDVREVGNKNVVKRGIRNKTVTLTFGSILDGYTIEEILSGQSADYGKIDLRELSTNLSFVGKVFTDGDKGTFKLGLKATKLNPSELGKAPAVDTYVSRRHVLEGEALTITNVEADLTDA